MAALTWYLTNASVSVGSDLSDSDPGAEAFRSPVTGWIVGTGSTNHSEWFNDTERASSTFTGTTVPDGSLDTTNGDFWVSPSPLTGDFASGDWNVHFACRANTGGGAQDGRMRCRLFRGANQDGSSATEITVAQQQGGLVTNLTTSATQVSTATFNPGAFSVSGEYIFIQLAWERTGAAGMTTHDVNARIGNGSGTGSRVITADFQGTRRAQVSWGELEVPNAPRRAQVSWAEFEVPTAPRRAQVSWGEFEVPDSMQRRAQVSWGELEVPTAPRRAQISWGELEVPNAPRRAQVSWAELEVPDFTLRRAQVSWAEFEVPNVPVVGGTEIQPVLMMRDVGKMMNRS